MSRIALSGNLSGTGTFTLASTLQQTVLMLHGLLWTLMPTAQPKVFMSTATPLQPTTPLALATML